jgi:hypothetical protein
MDSVGRRGAGGQSCRRKKLTAEDEFWCEFSLALGGRSIAEWQAAVSEEERITWIAYRAKRGPLNPLLRQDAALARIAHLICVAAKIKAQDGSEMTVADFMPWAKDEEPEPNVDASITGVLEAFGVKKNG